MAGRTPDSPGDRGGGRLARLVRGGEGLGPLPWLEESPGLGNWEEGLLFPTLAVYLGIGDLHLFVNNRADSERVRVCLHSSSSPRGRQAEVARAALQGPLNLRLSS